MIIASGILRRVGQRCRDDVGECRRNQQQVEVDEGQQDGPGPGRNERELMPPKVLPSLRIETIALV